MTIPVMEAAGLVGPAVRQRLEAAGETVVPLDIVDRSVDGFEQVACGLLARTPGPLTVAELVKAVRTVEPPGAGRDRPSGPARGGTPAVRPTTRPRRRSPDATVSGPGPGRGEVEPGSRERRSSS